MLSITDWFCYVGFDYHNCFVQVCVLDSNGSILGNQVTPKNASSGKRMADGGLVKAGSLVLRTMLVETAHRLARYQPQWKALKEQLKERGKPASVAAAAVANRWVRKLFWEMREVDVNEEVAA